MLAEVEHLGALLIEDDPAGKVGIVVESAE